MTKRVMLWTQEPVLAAGLGAVISEMEGFELSLLCSDPELLLPEVDRYRPDLLLVALPEDMKVEALPLKRTALLTKIVLWTRSVYPELSLDAINSGVRGSCGRPRRPRRSGTA